MSYTAWSVVFGEQPAAAKWNLLGANDASFADGTGISALSHAVTSVANPYKFSAYKTTGQTGISSATKISYQTELFDTNSNYDNATNYRYVAPVAGFYLLKASIYISSSTSYAGLDFYKNGVLYRPGDAQSSSSSGDVVVSNVGLLQLAATDYIECFVRWGGGGTRNIYGLTDVAVGTTGPSIFEGFLVSRT